MIHPATDFYFKAKIAVEKEGYGDEAAWAENIKPLEKQTYETFVGEYVWVVLNAGMKEQVARGIYDRFWAAMKAYPATGSPYEVIGHYGKRKAIREMMLRHHTVLWELQNAADPVAYLETLPWIGPITKYHLARNLGIDVVKPDRHLVRLAERFGFASPLEMCQAIQADLATLVEPHLRPDRLGTIDVVLWRYCNLGGCAE